MEIDDRLLDELLDRVLAEIGNTVEFATLDVELSDEDYASIWNAYREELINELK